MTSEMTNSTETPAGAQATPELYDVIIYMSSTFLVGPTSMMANLLVITVIGKNKNLQSPCFFLIFMESCCSMVMAAGLIVDALDDLLVIVQVDSLLKSRWRCYLQKSLLLMSSVPTSSQIALLLSVDRLLSVLFPIAYGWFSRYYVTAGASLCLGHTVASVTAALFYGDSLQNVIACPNVFASLHPNVLHYIIGLNVTLASAAVIAYVLMLICFQWRRRRLMSAVSGGGGGAGDQAESTFLKQQKTVLPTVKLLIAVYIVSGAAPEFAVNIVGYCGSCFFYMPRVFIYVSLLKEYVTLSTIIALTVASRQFRLCARNMLCSNRSQNNNTRALSDEQKGLDREGGGPATRIVRIEPVL